MTPLFLELSSRYDSASEYDRIEPISLKFLRLECMRAFLGSCLPESPFKVDLLFFNATVEALGILGFNKLEITAAELRLVLTRIIGFLVANYSISFL